MIYREKATGVQAAHGLTPVLTQQQQAEALQRRAEGAALKVLATGYDVSAATICRPKG